MRLMSFWTAKTLAESHPATVDRKMREVEQRVGHPIPRGAWIITAETIDPTDDSKGLEISLWVAEDALIENV